MASSTVPSTTYTPYSISSAAARASTLTTAQSAPGNLSSYTRREGRYRRTSTARSRSSRRSGNYSSSPNSLI
ncbi:hypothetical protein FOPG_18957 [Fusarium oxysporum f. sp. conglutinans race 2 54008]|uniref:Uncharacterized protein n=1 Tax=Fusarium oxysporum f. sp. conglutinans race 2 54008 TaxID=1089457 RepID=X0HUI1_FUSOX|nr:hypothetical protein FOPG_18957 [Fusarium oxysporum f. sp. conglutinans race 2 54008]